MKLQNIALIIIASIGLAGCGTTFKERKAPCPPTASLSKNPCDTIPINFAGLKANYAGQFNLDKRNS